MNLEAYMLSRDKNLVRDVEFMTYSNRILAESLNCINKLNEKGSYTTASHVAGITLESLEKKGINKETLQ